MSTLDMPFRGGTVRVASNPLPPLSGRGMRNHDDSESADITWPTIDGMDLGEEDFDMPGVGQVRVQHTPYTGPVICTTRRVYILSRVSTKPQPTHVI